MRKISHHRIKSFAREISFRAANLCPTAWHRHCNSQKKVAKTLRGKVMKILIAYDGSSCAEAALDDLVRAGLPEAGEFLVISVAEVWLAREQQTQQWEAENLDSYYLTEITSVALKVE